MEIYFKNLTPEEGTAQKLLHDLRTLREDTEELFAATGGKLAQKSKEKFLSSMERAKATCLSIQGRAAAGARTADRAVHQHPYSAIGVGFTVGLIVGILATRSK
ncbi:MAG: hypothetical protein JWQ71_3451 [Pedosphaera sp.]|nr:hypothetical protein [Pedosphaera sp.]